MNKLLIQKRFGRAQTSYNQKASIQRRMALMLVDKLSGLHSGFFPAALEVGMGTGLLTRLLAEKLSIGHLWGNDLVPQLNRDLEIYRQRQWLTYWNGDAEQLDLAGHHFDLIISNAALQWFERPLEALTTWMARLQPQGLLAFTTFGPDHFQAFAKTLGPSLTYFPRQVILETLAPFGTCRWVHEEHLRLHFPSFLELLRHLKATGVNALVTRTWTKSSLEQLSTRYRAALRFEDDYQLDYHPYWFIFQKKESGL